MAISTVTRVQTTDRTVNQLQDNLKSALTPVLKNQLVHGNLLQSVSLNNGSNSVDHKLNQPLTGWFIVRQRSAAQIYDNQDNNNNAAVTLLLVSNASVVVDLYVF